MVNRVPSATQTCYEQLTTTPCKQIPRRVFPLRGRPFRDLWEYEVTGAERLYYLPDAHHEREMLGWEPDKQNELVCLVVECGGHIPPPQRH